MIKSCALKSFPNVLPVLSQTIVGSRKLSWELCTECWSPEMETLHQWLSIVHLNTYTILAWTHKFIQLSTCPISLSSQILDHIHHSSICCLGKSSFGIVSEGSKGTCLSHLSRDYRYFMKIFNFISRMYIRINVTLIGKHIWIYSSY